MCVGADRGVVEAVQSGRLRHVGPSSRVCCDHGFRLGISRGSSWFSRGSIACIGASAGHVPARRHADAWHGGARVWRHGEWIKPPDCRFRSTCFAGFWTRHRCRVDRVYPGRSGVLGHPLCPPPVCRMGGRAGVRHWRLSAFFRAAEFVPLADAGFTFRLWRAADRDRPDWQ